MSAKLKALLVAVVFNLLFEFSIRGVGGLFAQPLYPLWIGLIYLAYYAIVEDLVRRFNLSNLQLLLLSFTFGVIPEIFLTGSILTPSGINWGAFFFINIFWWWPLQGLLTMYVAHRIVPRDWKEKSMGWLGWSLTIGYLLLLILRGLRTTPKGPAIFGIAFMIIGSLTLYLWLRSQHTKNYALEQSRILDALGISTTVFYLFLGFFIATTRVRMGHSLLNPTAFLLSTAWTVVVFLGIMIYYAINRKSVTI